MFSVQLFVVVTLFLFVGDLCQAICPGVKGVRTNPLGLKNVGEKRYWIGNRKKVTHSEALASCLRYGMELVNINDCEENTIVHNLIKDSTSALEPYWTAGNKLNDANVWVWSRGIPITYFNWASGEPNNKRSNEECIEFHNSFYNDHTCSSQRYFICESIDNNNDCCKGKVPESE